MAEPSKDAFDPDATVRQPAAAEPDPESTVRMPAREPDPEATFAGPAAKAEPDAESTVLSGERKDTDPWSGRESRP